MRAFTDWGVTLQQALSASEAHVGKHPLEGGPSGGDSWLQDSAPFVGGSLAPDP